MIYFIGITPFSVSSLPDTWTALDPLLSLDICKFPPFLWNMLLLLNRPHTHYYKELMRLSQLAFLRERKKRKGYKNNFCLKDKASLIINEHITRKQYVNSAESEKAWRNWYEKFLFLCFCLTRWLYSNNTLVYKSPRHPLRCRVLRVKLHLQAALIHKFLYHNYINIHTILYGNKQMVRKSWDRVNTVNDSVTQSDDQC